MSDENITPIRPVQAPPTLATIEARAGEIRELIFQAQSIVNVAAAAIGSGSRIDAWSAEKTLDTVSKLLDDAAGRLEPEVFTAEVAHG